MLGYAGSIAWLTRTGKRGNQLHNQVAAIMRRELKRWLFTFVIVFTYYYFGFLMLALSRLAGGLVLVLLLPIYTAYLLYRRHTPIRGLARS